MAKKQVFVKGLDMGAPFDLPAIQPAGTSLFFTISFSTTEHTEDTEEETYP